MAACLSCAWAPLSPQPRVSARAFDELRRSFPSAYRTDEAPSTARRSLQGVTTTLPGGTDATASGDGDETDNQVYGTAYGDSITGGSGGSAWYASPDYYLGGDVTNTIYGLGGDDELIGGSAGMSVQGASGGSAWNYLYGGAGNDRLLGGANPGGKTGSALLNEMHGAWLRVSPSRAAGHCQRAAAAPHCALPPRARAAPATGGDGDDYLRGSTTGYHQDIFYGACRLRSAQM